MQVPLEFLKSGNSNHIQAKILIFPHHVELPGQGTPMIFTKELMWELVDQIKYCLNSLGPT